MAGLEVQHLPNTLILHLDRLDAQNGQIVRINHPVAAPEMLDLSAYDVDGYYALKSFIYHEGSVDDGHYLTLTREFDDTWTKYDDQTVTRNTDVNQYRSTVIIYFYEKVVIDGLLPPQPPAIPIPIPIPIPPVPQFVPICHENALNLNPHVDVLQVIG